MLKAGVDFYVTYFLLEKHSGEGIGLANCDHPVFCNSLGTLLKFRISNFLLLIRLTGPGENQLLVL